MTADPVTLSRLVDTGDVDGVLAFVSLDEIADAWCQWSLRQHRGDVPPTTDQSDWFSTDPHWWALEFWWLVSGREGVAAREAVARDLLVSLVDHAPSDDVLLHIGAGPFEEFIRADEDRVRWIEEQAVSSAKFRTALGNVWIWSEPDWVFERIEHAARIPLAHPGHRRPT
jgi:Family of unknown function (DUF6869)